MFRSSLNKGSVESENFLRKNTPPFGHIGGVFEKMGMLFSL